MRKGSSGTLPHAPPKGVPLDRQILGQLYPKPQFPPTIRELGEELGRGPTTIRYHLGRLRAAGLVTWEPTIGRTITITDAGVAALTGEALSTGNGDPP